MRIESDQSADAAPLVIGIGASAGGVAALEAFMRAVPPGTPWAWVIIQHLPIHDMSAMPDLISRWTGLPVTQVREPTQVRAGHVYLPLAGHGLLLREDCLELADLPFVGIAQRPIDFFLRSLAAAKRSRAIGVVLSGMLNDGAMGLYSIRQQGGLGLVQDPETAEFDSMPKAAIEAHGADRILPPQDMPAAILDYLATTRAVLTGRSAWTEHRHEILNRIAEALTVQKLRSFRGYKKTTLLRRVSRRMSLCGIQDYDAYLQRLESDAGEAHHLAQDLMIGVTSFFRDAEAYRIIESSVIPLLFEGGTANRPLRIWIAGCATGQEAYSIAMLLSEYNDRLPTPRLISIFATDINDSALDVARSGVYLPSEVRNIEPQRLQRHFTSCNQGYQINKPLRELLVFAQHNLVSDPPFSRIDLIVCRNVFIYMEPEIQRRLLTMFQYALTGGGFLFLGNSESIGPQQRHFETISKPWRIFRSLFKEPAHRKELISYTGASFTRFSMLSSEIDVPHAATNERLYNSLINRHGVAQVLIDVNHDILFSTGNTSDFLAFPSGEPSDNLYASIKPGLFTLVRSAIEQTLRENVRTTLVGACSEDGYTVRVQALPVQTGKDSRLVLLALEREPAKVPCEVRVDGGDSVVVQQLEQELLATRDDLQRTIEHLRSSNEELKAVYEEAVAMNEELQSANEEMESSKEELQSLNEELLASNSTLDLKVAELQEVNNDLNNLFGSTDIATIFLDKECRIKRYTPAMDKLVHLIGADIGRPISDIAHTLVNCDFKKNARQVLESGQPDECEVRDTQGRWYIKRVLPYLTEQQQIEGVVITFSEVTDLKQTQQELQSYAERLQRQAYLLELAPVMARDLEDRIIFWNQGATNLYGWSKEEAMGKISHHLLKTCFPSPREQIRDEVMREGQWKGDLVHTTRDGSKIAVASLWQLARDCDGKPWAVVEVNNDISQRVKAEQDLRESEQRFRQVAETLPQVVWLTEWSGVSDGDEFRLKILYASSMFEKVWGYPVHHLYANPSAWVKNVHPDDRDRIAEQVLCSIPATSLEYECRIVRDDGETRMIHAHVLPIQVEGSDKRRCVFIMEDVTESRRAEHRLRQAAAVYECTAEGVMITDAGGCLIAVNHAFSAITGYQPDEVLGGSPKILSSGRHDVAFYRKFWSQLNEAGHWQGEMWNRRKNGEVYPEWLTVSCVRSERNQVLNYVGVFSDISRIKRSEEQLWQLAHFDPLTQLPNRLLLLSRLEHALNVVQRQGGMGAVLFLDLDRFKTINDCFGHPVGDDLLVAIAESLRSRLRDEDTLARMGGDEFVVLMEDLKRSEDAAELAQALLELIAAPFFLPNGSEACVTGSIGIALFPDDARGATELLQHADAAMYQAKESGRNTFRFYSHDLTERAKERLELESELRRAVENQEFVLHYQPQVDLATGRICGCEALIRWQPPGGELMPPTRFIPLAEENGAIVAIGQWVLRQACKDAVAWIREGHDDLTLAVNLSPRQFMQPGLVSVLHDILHDTGFPARNLELEITESAIMEHGQNVEVTLSALKALGVKISIDDFGTGYSSLAYLKRFPIDKLKIDRGFVKDIPQDLNDMEIAATIIAMSRNLGMRVLAEGVETEEQLRFLRERGCDAYQGYLFSPPLSRTEWLEMLGKV